MLKKLDKIHHIIPHVLKNIGKDVGTIELVKIIYLIDVQYFKLFGEKMTNLGYIRHKKGPYTREITNAVADLEEIDDCPLSIKHIFSKGNSPFIKKAHKFKDSNFKIDLSNIERFIINSVLEKIKSLDVRQLEKESYKTKPMLDILGKEKKAKIFLYYSPLDFSLIERDSFMQEWESNKDKTKEDEEYNKFLECEKEEMREVFSSS